MNTPETASAAVKQEARRLGFAACGVAEAGGAIDPEGHLLEWLKAGRHAGMDWMARPDALAKRRDIQLWLPGARSVVVAVAPYPAGDEAGEDNRRIARFAQVSDYHKRLRPAMKALARFIGGLETGALTKWSMDTGAILEKQWAARAGVGWQGKNSLIISPGVGSWCNLGVIATTLELAPDPPMASQCGECRLCVIACPTGAIISPSVVDARRCLAYLTIEHRGALSQEQQALVDAGGWDYGCDTCQEACPWNKETSLMDKNEILIALSESSQTDFGKKEFASQSFSQKVFSSIWAVESEVNNGGFLQYFLNDNCETAVFVVEAMETIGAPKTADICRRAIAAVFPDGLPSEPEQINAAAEDSPTETEDQLIGLDTEFFEYPHDLTELLFIYISMNPDEFGQLPDAS